MKKRLMRALLLVSIMMMFITGCSKTTDCEICGDEAKCKSKECDGDKIYVCSDCQEDIDDYKRKKCEVCGEKAYCKSKKIDGEKIYYCYDCKSEVKNLKSCDFCLDKKKCETLELWGDEFNVCDDCYEEYHEYFYDYEY